MKISTLYKTCTIRTILFIIFVTTTCVFAQEDEIEIYNEIRETRTLGEHYFTPNNTLKYPFILTHARMSLGIGQINNIQFPLVEVDGNEYLYLQGGIFAALLKFEYQHAIKEWLALYVRFGLIGRLGSDFGTLVVQGINYGTTFDIGWMIRIFRDDKFILSTSVGVSNGDYSFINLQNFVEDVIDQVPYPRITTSNNSLYGLIGLKAAYGFTKFLGLNVLADLGYGETIQRELENKWFTNLGLNIDMNFADIIKTPLSLSIGYLFSNYPQNNNDVVFNKNIAFTQFSYIGRTNFILSLDLSISKEFAGRKEKAFWLNTTEFSMRYLF